MSGFSNFPSVLDSDTELYDVTDGVTALIDDHHNNIKEAVKAIEKKLGIDNTSVPTSIDYRLGHPSAGHTHDGASGQGARINATVLGLRHVVPWYYPGSVPSGPSLGIPFSFGLTSQIESVQVNLKTPPSGATFALDVNIGPTSLWAASQGNRPILPAGSAYFGHASPNFVTYPSGALITIDADKVGTSDPGRDLSVVFVFRD